MDDDVVVRRIGADEAALATRLRLAFLAEFRGVDVASFAPAFVAATRDFLAAHLADGTVRSWVVDVDGAATGLRALVLHTTDDGRAMYAAAGFRPDERWRELVLPSI